MSESKASKTPREIASSSFPPVSTVSVRLPTTIAVPVSWHIGSTPPAETQALRSRSVRDEAVVRRRLGVVDDRAQLGEVRRAQQVGDVADGGAHQRGQRRGRDLEELAAERGDVDQVAYREVETAVLGGVGAQGQHVGVVELGHAVTIRGDPRRAW